MSVRSYRDHNHVSFHTAHSSQPYFVTEDDEHVLPHHKKHSGEAWWSVGDIIRPTGITHQNAAVTMTTNGDKESWDISDSLVDLYAAQNHLTAQKFRSYVKFEDRNIDVTKWLESNADHGCIRVYHSDQESASRLFPCTLTTTAQKICLHYGIPANSLHVQMNGDIIRRMEPFDCPLAMQNSYLTDIGYTDRCRIQELGSDDLTSYLIKFFAGKPVIDGTYSRHQLSAFVYVRKGKLLHQWVRRKCVLSGTRLLIYRDKTSKPTFVQLANGMLEEVQVKGQNHCIKVTSTEQGGRSIYMSFMEENEYLKWHKKLHKATAKLPTKADLSNCHLEFLPETIFVNEHLRVLLLRHNALRDRPIEDDIYTLGWLDDLPRFLYLQSLNLSDNNLMTFPLAVCRMKSLIELNLASNKIEEIPSHIADLVNLKLLHIHNNRLQSLPDVLMEMKNLNVVVLAFNKFVTIPNVLLQSKLSTFKLDSLIMAGNLVERLPVELFEEMTHVKKIDLRMNKLKVSSTDMTKFGCLEHVTHLDVRDNLLDSLDVRAIRSLAYLNCERNNIKSLYVNGSSIKTLLASHNHLETLTISPKAEYVTNMNLSHNRLKDLPSWIGDCFFLATLDVGHNLLTSVPDRLFNGAQKLKILKLNHNRLQKLCTDVSHCIIEELHLQHNLITHLPEDLFIHANRLRYLNLTSNQLTDLPLPNSNESLNKLQELYLTGNQLGNQAIHKCCYFVRLRILHLSNNKITHLNNSDLEKLELLQDLNISFNNLHELPEYLCRHPKLQVLRVNSNIIQELPNFRNSSMLKVLEVGSNRLMNVNMKNLMTSQVNLLDISGNPDITLSSHELNSAKSKKICMVDMRGQNRSLLDLSSIEQRKTDKLWQSGFSQTSGIRNKLSVAVINKTHFIGENESLFAVFDGGRNEEIAKSLSESFPEIVEKEMEAHGKEEEYLKYSMLTAHRKLKSLGQRLGASVGVMHIEKPAGSGDKCPPVLHVANVGDVQVVLYRKKQPVCLTQIFTVSENTQECDRICQSDGIITEDGRVSGVTYNTRMLGCSYLYPQVIPKPHLNSLKLTEEDQLIIIANQGLWNYMSYTEAVEEVKDIPDPVVAAKRLQDLAQGYGSRENIAILVVRLLLSEKERLRIKTLLQRQLEGQKHLLTILRQHAEMIRAKERQESEAQFGPIKFDKSGHVKQVSKSRPVISSNSQLKNLEAALQTRLKDDVKNKEIQYDFSPADVGDTTTDLTFDENDIYLKSKNKNIPVATWENNLQKRLTDEVKDREMEYMFNFQEDDVDAEMTHVADGTNWSTTSRKKQIAQSEGSLPHRKVVIPENNGTALQDRSESLDTIASFEEFSKQPVIQHNIDRDAILFHQMQIARAQSSSTTSIDSTQSDPMHASEREVFKLPNKNSSHSIEVLVGKPKINTSISNHADQIIEDESEENEIFAKYDENLDEIYARVQKQSPSLITHTDKDPKATSHGLMLKQAPVKTADDNKSEDDFDFGYNLKPKAYNPYLTDINSNSITSIEDLAILQLSEADIIMDPDQRASNRSISYRRPSASSSEGNSTNSSPTLQLRRVAQSQMTGQTDSTNCSPTLQHVAPVKGDNSPTDSPKDSPTDSPKDSPKMTRTESQASVIITYL